MPDYEPDCDSDCSPSCGPKQVFSMDTGSGMLTEGPVYHRNLHRLRPASMFSPDGNAILLRSNPSIYTILELPSLAVRGSLRPPSLDKCISKPDAIWEDWTSYGSSIAVLWTNAEKHLNPQAAVYGAATSKLLRNTRILVSAKMKVLSSIKPDAVQAKYDGKMAISLDYEHSRRHVACFALVDLTRNEPPIVHDIVIRQGPYAPDIFPSPSGDFLAITVDREWCLDEEETGPDHTFLLPSTGTGARLGPFAVGRTPIWVPSTSRNICIFPGQRNILHLNETRLQYMPAARSPSTHEAQGPDEFGDENGMGIPDSSDEDCCSDYMAGDPPSRTTVDGGLISPCGSLKVAVSTTDIEGQIEHWPLDSADESRADGGPKCVPGLPLPSFANVYMRSSIAVPWHPTLQSELVYALAAGQGTIYLIDGRMHWVRHAWTFCNAFPIRYSPLSAQKAQTMEWSPDGTRLAVKGSEAIFIVQADVHADNKMFKVPDGRGFVL